MNMRETKIENLSKAIAGGPQVMNFVGVVVIGAVLGAQDGFSQKEPYKWQILFAATLKA
jgi:hypothetical protein